MTDLSPAAQIAIEAWWNASDGEYINGVWTPNRSAQLAAALQAVADEVVPETAAPWNSTLTPLISAKDVRSKILAIAAELRGGTTQENS